MNRIAVFSIFLVLATALVVLGARSLNRPEYPPLLAWQDDAVVQRGQAIYAQQCGGCHGANGEGQTAGAGQVGPLAPPHDQNGHTWQHPDFALIQLTKEGVSSVACITLDENSMPKFEKTLSDRDILDVLSFLKSRWPAEIIEKQEQTNALYRDHNAAMWSRLNL